MFILLACLMVLRCSLAKTPPKTLDTYLPRLPVGEYHIVYEAMYPCENTKNQQIALNVYFSKKSRNVTEIKGNVTSKVPLDDRLNVELNMSQWGSTGGWVPNTYVVRYNKYCKEMKQIMGKAWFGFAEGFNFPSTDCPIPAGTYVSSGLDVRVLDEMNVPKIYFYGRYKLTAYIRDKNNILVGCFALETRLVRPWERTHY